MTKDKKDAPILYKPPGNKGILLRVRDVAGTSLAGTALGALPGMAGIAINSRISKPITPGAVKGYKALGEKLLGAPIHVWGEPAGFLQQLAGDASRYTLGDKGTHIIGLKEKSLPIFLHELGHAKAHLNAAKHPILTRIRHGLYNKGPFIGGIAGLLAAMSPNEGVRTYAPYIAAAGGIPAIIEEGRASWNALKWLHKLKGMKGALKGAIPLGLGGLGYVGATMAAPAISAYLLSKLRDKYKDTHWRHK